MKLSGHKTEAIYRRYAIVSDSDLREGTKKIAADSTAPSVRVTCGVAHPRYLPLSSQKVYVAGNASTNTIESFWSLVKRGISGVHHCVSDKYLQDYLNAYAFRWNHRNDDASMFHLILRRLPASRPTPTVAKPIERLPQNPFV